MNGSERPVLSLAELDELARSDPGHIFTGKLNMVIMVARILENHRMGRLCCFECCGVPLYANRPIAICKNCNTERTLALNPRIIGSLVDETGSISVGKPIWSDRAWTELFFGKGSYRPPANNMSSTKEGGNDSVCSWEVTVGLEQEDLRSVEEQLQYSRVALMFGWSSDVGRLCILGVEW